MTEELRRALDTIMKPGFGEAGKVSAPDNRSCTCYSGERPEPCERKFASRDCWRSAVLKETQQNIVALKNRDRQPHEQALLNYLMRVREVLER